MKEAFPSNNYGRLSHDTKKNMRKLGLTFIKIDSCIYGCMLYYIDNAHLQQRKFCEGCTFCQNALFFDFSRLKGYLYLIVLLAP